MRNGRKIREPLPMQNVEVSHKNMGVRFILFLVFIAIAIAGIAVGIYFLVRVDKGWQTIEPRSSAKTNCSGDFSFYYYFNGSGASNRSTARALENKYTELTVTLYEEFADVPITDVNNVYYINHHANEIIEVDSYLYSSLRKASASRYLFGAPVATYYQEICSSTEDWQAAEFDPARSDTARAKYLEILAYALDENHINLEFLEDSKIRLNVSQEYLDYAAANDILSFIDFGYFKNAFIIDRMAKELIDLGYTSGLITSYDGYTRTLSDQNCSYDLFASINKTEYYSGVAQLSGNYASVNLSAFPTNTRDVDLHYRYSDGTYVHCYFDLDDSISKCSVDQVILYSATKNCSDLIFQALPVWIDDDLNTAFLSSYVTDGIDYVYSDGTKVHYSSADLKVTMRPEIDDLVFEAIKD